MHGSLAQGIRNTSTSTDRPRQTDTDTDTHKHRQTKTDKDRHRQTHTDKDKHRKTQTNPDRHRHRQGCFCVSSEFLRPRHRPVVEWHRAASLRAASAPNSWPPLHSGHPSSETEPAGPQVAISNTGSMTNSGKNPSRGSVLSHSLPCAHPCQPSS